MDGASWQSRKQLSDHGLPAIPSKNRRIMQPIRRAMSHEEVIAKSKKNQRREMISHPNSDRRHHPTKG